MSGGNFLENKANGHTVDDYWSLLSNIRLDVSVFNKNFLIFNIYCEH